MGIAVETLALLVRFWLATTPPLPESAAKAPRARARARGQYNSFVAALGHRLPEHSGTDQLGEQHGYRVGTITSFPLGMPVISSSTMAEIASDSGAMRPIAGTSLPRSAAWVMPAKHCCVGLPKTR